MGAAPSRPTGTSVGHAGVAAGGATAGSGLEAAGPQRPALGARPAHAGDSPPPGFTLANTAAARVGGASALFPTRLREKPLSSVYPAPVQQQAVVRNVCNLKKSSLRLVRARKDDGSADPDVYVVEFEFDAKVDGFITVYYVASQVEKRDGTDKAARVEDISFRAMHRKRPSKTRFSAGVSQTYRQKAPKGLHIKEYAHGDLIYSADRDRDRYPIVIRLEALYPSDSSIPEASRVQMQTTFATLTGPDDQGIYSCALLRQDVLVGGTLFKMQELYGINGAVSGELDDAGEGFTVDKATGNECVVCLTEACIIAVRPCNHLCLCDDCADILLNDTNFDRRRCPICRSPIGSLLRIISKVPSPGASEDGGSGDVSGVGSESGAGSSTTVPCIADEGDTGSVAIDIVNGNESPANVGAVASRPSPAQTIASSTS